MLQSNKDGSHLCIYTQLPHPPQKVKMVTLTYLLLVCCNPFRVIVVLHAL